jgi:predicted PurR-regulated permease PerM
MENSNSSGDAFITIFFIAIILIFFVLPIWLMIKHHKRSKAKLAKLKADQAQETPEEASSRKKDNYTSLASILGMIAGVLIGSRLFDNILLGFLLGVVFGTMASLLVDRIHKKS